MKYFFTRKSLAVYNTPWIIPPIILYNADYNFYNKKVEGIEISIKIDQILPNTQLICLEKAPS